MQVRRYIWSIGLLLSLWSVAVNAQDPRIRVCSGDTAVDFHVAGWANSTFQWTVEGGVITRDLGDTIYVDWPVVPGEYELSVMEISEFGCAGEIQRAIVEVVGPDIDLGGDTYICEGDLFELAPEGNIASYLWHDGSTDPDYSTNQEGWISLEVTDSWGCVQKDSLYLSVYALPVVDLGGDTSLCSDQSLQLDAGPDGVLYTWSTGDATRQIDVFQGYQEIWVEVENAFGCTTGDTIIIEPCDLEFYFRDMPTAITPNGDGVNDVWNLEKLGGYSQVVVEIFDQWGTLVWRSEPGYPEPWNGNDMNGREMPVDSYHYVFNMNDGSDDRVIGIVTVIR